jgi:hypothetical protein
VNENSIATELLQRGDSLWSSVECDVKRDCVVIYARLRAHPSLRVEKALAESERVFTSVLERRLEGHQWLATVQWSERLCKTFTPNTLR